MPMLLDYAERELHNCRVKWCRSFLMVYHTEMSPAIPQQNILCQWQTEDNVYLWKFPRSWCQWPGLYGIHTLDGQFVRTTYFGTRLQNAVLIWRCRGMWYILRLPVLMVFLACFSRSHLCCVPYKQRKCLYQLQTKSYCQHYAHGNRHNIGFEIRPGSLGGRQGCDVWDLPYLRLFGISDADEMIQGSSRLPRKQHTNTVTLLSIGDVFSVIARLNPYLS